MKAMVDHNYNTRLGPTLKYFIMLALNYIDALKKKTLTKLQSAT